MEDIPVKSHDGPFQQEETAMKVKTKVKAGVVVLTGAD